MGVIWIVATCSAQQPMRTDVIRLHILANSDSDTDQSEKLWVRDLVLRHWGERLANLGDAKTAWTNLGALVPQIQADITQALKDNGIAYGVSVRTGVFDFPDRQYDGVDFPAGKYQALQVRLGEAKGHNWWCVMFPPLCLVGTDENFDIEKYKQMLRELQQQEAETAAATVKATVKATPSARRASSAEKTATPGTNTPGKTKETKAPQATAMPEPPQAPVRSWLVDELGMARQWDRSFMQWAKEFWLSGE